MYLITILGSSLLMVVYVSAYGGGGFGGGSGGGYGGGSYGGMGQMGSPKPYGFGYNAADQLGNSHFRKEQGDGSGGVRGSYGITDKQGLYRVVDYVANAGGFQAKVKTNEPGTDGKENPADVYMQAQPSPAGMQGYGNSFGQGRMGMGGKMMFY